MGFNPLNQIQAAADGWVDDGCVEMDGWVEEGWVEMDGCVEDGWVERM